jgi:hypothetical protein
MNISDIYSKFPQEIRNTSRELSNADNLSAEQKARLDKKVRSVALKAIGLVMAALAAVCLGNLAATLGTPIAATHFFSAISFSVASHEAAVIGHNLYRSLEPLIRCQPCHTGQTFSRGLSRIQAHDHGVALMEEENRSLLSGTWICGSIYTLVN